MPKIFLYSILLSTSDKKSTEITTAALIEKSAEQYAKVILTGKNKPAQELLV